jgi:hypothetical protein
MRTDFDRQLRSVWFAWHVVNAYRNKSLADTWLASVALREELDRLGQMASESDEQIVAERLSQRTFQHAPLSALAVRWPTPTRET